MLKSKNKTIPLITHPSTKALSHFTGLPTVTGALFLWWIVKWSLSWPWDSDYILRQYEQPISVFYQQHSLTSRLEAPSSVLPTFIHLIPSELNIVLRCTQESKQRDYHRATKLEENKMASQIFSELVLNCKKLIPCSRSTPTSAALYRSLRNTV